jgi:hypothetical protein
MNKETSSLETAAVVKFNLLSCRCFTYKTVNLKKFITHECLLQLAKRVHRF